MRLKLLHGGKEKLSDQELLEILLYYTIPRKDTAPTAIELYETFGSLRGVFDAPTDALMQISGVGESTASFLKLMPFIARRYSAGESSCVSFSCTDRVRIIRYLTVLYLGTSKEQMHMLAFNARGEFIRSYLLGGEEEISFVDVYKRRMVQTAIKSNASTVILSHTHPGGIAAPSSDDVRSTTIARDALQSVDVRLQDHVIFSSPNECLFLSELPAYRSLFY